MLVEKLSKEIVNDDFWKSVSEAYIASALVSEWAISLLDRNLNRNVIPKILVGIHVPSRPNAWKSLYSKQSDGSFQVKIISDIFFHCKVYLFKANSIYVAFIGSGNLTKGGFFENDELFIKLTDQDQCQKLLTWFETKFSSAKKLTEDFIEEISAWGESDQKHRHNQSLKLSVIIDKLEGRFNINSLDFTDQFFTKRDHETFSVGNAASIDELILDRRKEVRRKFYEINYNIEEEIKDKFSLYRHFNFDNVVSSIYPTFHG